MNPTLVFTACLVCVTLAPKNLASESVRPATTASRAVIDFDRLIPALITVESGGDDRAVGDRGNAKGCLQIWPSVIADVNRVYGTRYTHDDAFVREHAVTICKKYLSLYCTPQRIGREPSLADAARIWNGGPTGYRKTATLSYWNKVSRHLK
jgi:hypothetical protein